MPLPEPEKEETQREFIGRCMGDETMQAEFPESGQRAARCYGQWRKVKGKTALRELSKQARFERVSPEPQLKASDTTADAGWVEGYAAVYSNVDEQREMLLPGCFAVSAKEKVPAGKVPLMVRHFGLGGTAEEVVGMVTEAKEDSHGLWVHAEFSSSPRAQDVRIKASEGMVNMFSVGYRPVAWLPPKQGADGELYTEISAAELWEVTLVVFAANERTTVLGAKAVGAAPVVESVPPPATTSEAPAAAQLAAKQKAIERRSWLRREWLALQGKSFGHNSTLADDEPDWGGVDKTRLPRIAFADMGDPDAVSTWRFPHHWVRGGGAADEAGRVTTGTLYLHKGGLHAAWAAAHGARAGVEAGSAVKAHLNKHRHAIGEGEEE